MKTRFITFVSQLSVLFVLCFFLVQCSHAAPREAYVCQTDVDCTNSCLVGAVNAHWMKTHPQNTICSDGCATVTFDHPRCINQLCTAFQFGLYNETCTMGPKPDKMVLPDITRYSCEQNTDCMVSCSLGAVNKAWYKQWTQKVTGFSECDDGCEMLVESVRCEDHACVAYSYGNARQESCTRKK